MENMDKGLTVPKWVLIVWPKIPQMPQNLYAQFVCPSPKVWDFIEKRLHWASVVRVCKTLLMWCAKFNNGIFTTVARLGPSNPTLWYHFEKSRKSLTIYLLLTYTLGRHAILKKSKDWYFVTKIVLTYCEKKLF